MVRPVYNNPLMTFLKARRTSLINVNAINQNDVNSKGFLE